MAMLWAFGCKYSGLTGIGFEKKKNKIVEIREDDDVLTT